MFSENLKKVRTELRYTLDGMSEKLGVKTRTYVSWERENKMPPMELGTLLKKQLNVNLNWFCTGEGNMFNEPVEDTKEEKMKKWFNEMVREEFKKRGL
ncbi:MAG: helix-turn-helix transcriptional regulator [Clostridia bacterium]|nr:helix-turn-helix transcriptional regulator [Clostridia bacterium]